MLKRKSNILNYFRKNWVKVIFFLTVFLYAIDGYGFKDTLQLISVMVCMFLTILNVVEIYIETKHFILFKEIAISRPRIVFLTFSSLGIICLAIFILSRKAIIFSFSFAGFVLLFLLLYQLILKLIKS